jgi:hypothetical protein
MAKQVPIQGGGGGPVSSGGASGGGASMGGSPQFGPGSGVASTPVNGVRTGPSGSLGFPTPKGPNSTMYQPKNADPYRVIDQPAQVNSSKGGVQPKPGLQLDPSKITGMKDLPAVGRPKPNQGITVPGPNGGPPRVIGGELPGSVKITGPNPSIPKTPGRISSFLGGRGGGGLFGGRLGGGGGMFGQIK